MGVMRDVKTARLLNLKYNKICKMAGQRRRFGECVNVLESVGKASDAGERKVTFNNTVLIHRQK